MGRKKPNSVGRSDVATRTQEKAPSRQMSVAEKQATPSGDQVDLLFRAFSDRTRLRILHLLLRGETCVGDIVQSLRVPQPKVSRHLAHLRKAGLVTVHKCGLWSYYSLAAARTPFQIKLLECLRDCFSDVPEIQADEQRAKKIGESGGCCPSG